MIDDTIALRTLLEKGSDASFLRDMIGFAAERLMALETESLCGAAPGERSPDRRNQRNGYPLQRQRRPCDAQAWRPGLTDPRWHGRAAHSKAAAWRLFPRVP